MLARPLKHVDVAPKGRLGGGGLNTRGNGKNGDAVGAPAGDAAVCFWHAGHTIRQIAVESFS